MKFKPCDKCGSLHFNKKPFQMPSTNRWWCGYCGHKVERVGGAS